MTQNQIAYWNMMESRRHNEALEGIQQQEADIKQQDADTRSDAQEESEKHNRHTEWISEIRYDLDDWNLTYGPEALRANAASKDAETRRQRMLTQNTTDEVYGAINAASTALRTAVSLGTAGATAGAGASGGSLGFPSY